MPSLIHSADGYTIRHEEATPNFGRNSIGDRMRRARCLRRMTAVDLGKHVGVSRKTIYNWENNMSYPEMRTFLKVCRALKVSPNFLTGITYDDA